MAPRWVGDKDDSITDKDNKSRRIRKGKEEEEEKLKQIGQWSHFNASMHKTVY